MNANEFNFYLVRLI